MRLLSAFLTLPLLFLAALPCAFAQEVQEARQHSYQEVDYETYPVEMMGSYIRVQNWLQHTQVEIDKIMHTAHPRVAEWRNAILAVPMDDDKKMLDRINAITNNYVPYVSDYDRYHKDYWATPIETLMRGGDCEDIALLKAVALNLKKWDDDSRNSTHLLIGLMNEGNKMVPHAALEVDTADDGHYVMNNLSDDVLTFDDMNLQMKPLYMIDATGVTGFVKPNHSLASVAASAGARNGETVPIQWDTGRIYWDEPDPVN